MWYYHIARCPFLFRLESRSFETRAKRNEFTSSLTVFPYLQPIRSPYEYPMAHITRESGIGKRSYSILSGISECCLHTLQVIPETLVLDVQKLPGGQHRTPKSTAVPQVLFNPQGYRSFCLQNQSLLLFIQTTVLCPQSLF